MASQDGRPATLATRLVTADGRAATRDGHLVKKAMRMAKLDGRTARLDGRTAKRDGRMGKLDIRMAKLAVRVVVGARLVVQPGGPLGACAALAVFASVPPVTRPTRVSVISSPRAGTNRPRPVDCRRPENPP